MMNRKENEKFKSVFKRFGQETPIFFRKTRNLGLVITAIGTTLLTSPIVLPSCIMGIAGYLTVAGAVAIAMSQAVTTDEFEM